MVCGSLACLVAVFWLIGANVRYRYEKTSEQSGHGFTNRCLSGKSKSSIGKTETEVLLEKQAGRRLQKLINRLMTQLRAKKGRLIDTGDQTLGETCG